MRAFARERRLGACLLALALLGLLLLAGGLWGLYRWKNRGPYRTFDAVFLKREAAQVMEKGCGKDA